MWTELMDAIKGFFEWGGSEPRESSAAGCSGSAFQRHMQFLSAESGHRLWRLKPDLAVFEIQYRGGRLLAVHPEGSKVLFRVLSKVAFPRHQVPSDVIRFMRKQNAELEQCSYELIEDEEDMFICVSCRIALDKLNVPTFEAIVEELIPRMTVLDDVLVERGYAR
jgi:hypothetical protein